MSFFKGSSSSYYSKRFYSDVYDDPVVNASPLTKHLSNSNVLSPKLPNDRLSKRLCTTSVASGNNPLSRTSSLHVQPSNLESTTNRRRDSSLLTFTAPPSDSVRGTHYPQFRRSNRDQLSSSIRRSSSLHAPFPFCVPNNGKGSSQGNHSGNTSLLHSLKTSHNVMRDRDEKESVIRALKILESKKRRFGECSASEDGCESISRDELPSVINSDNNSKRQRLLSHSSVLDDRSSVSSLTGSTSQEVLTKLRDDETFQLTSIGDIVSPSARNIGRSSFGGGLGGRRQSLRRTILDPDGSISSLSVKNGPETISDQGSSVSSHEFSPQVPQKGPPSTVSSVIGSPSEHSRASGKSNSSMRRRLSYMTPSQIEAHATKRSAAAQLMRRDSIDKVSQRTVDPTKKDIHSPNKRNNITQTDTSQSTEAKSSKTVPLRNKTLSVTEFIANLEKNRRQVRTEEINSTNEPTYSDPKNRSNTVLENRLSRIRRLLVNFTDEDKQPSNFIAELGTQVPPPATSSTHNSSNNLSLFNKASENLSSAPIVSTITTSSAVSQSAFPAISVTTTTTAASLDSTRTISVASVCQTETKQTSLGESSLVPANLSIPITLQSKMTAPINKSLTDLKSAEKSGNPLTTASSNFSFGSTNSTANLSTPSMSSFAFGTKNVTVSSTPGATNSTFGTTCQSQDVNLQKNPTLTTANAISTGGFSFGKTSLASDPNKTPLNLSQNLPESVPTGLHLPIPNKSANMPASTTSESMFNFSKSQDTKVSLPPSTATFVNSQPNSSVPTFAFGKTTVTSIQQQKAPPFGFSGGNNLSKTDNSQISSVPSLSFDKQKAEIQKTPSTNFIFKTSETSKSATASNPTSLTKNASFTFGNTKPQTQDVLNPQQSATPLQKSSSTMFNFGKPKEVSSLTSSASFTFGKTSEISDPSKRVGSLFNSSSATSTNAPVFATHAPSSFSFGKSNSDAKNEKLPNPSSIFGSAISNTVTAPSTTPLFGSNVPSKVQASTPIFGSSAPVPNASQSSTTLFGSSTSNTTASQNSTIVFGSGAPVATPSQGPTPIFGSSAPGAAPSQGPTPIFGSGAPGAAPLQNSTSIFGSGAPGAAPLQNSTSIFGSGAPGAAPSQGPTPIFGSGAPGAAPSQGPTPIFGSGAPGAAPLQNSTSIFGSGAPVAAPSQSSTSIFGSGAPVATPSQNSTSIFGSGAPGAAPSQGFTPIFGSGAPVATPSQSSTSIFGSGAPVATTSQSLTPIFGSSAPVQNPSHGSTSNAGSGVSRFGTFNSSSNSSNTLKFGNQLTVVTQPTSSQVAPNLFSGNKSTSSFSAHPVNANGTSNFGTQPQSSSLFSNISSTTQSGNGFGASSAFSSNSSVAKPFTGNNQSSSVFPSTQSASFPQNNTSTAITNKSFNFSNASTVPGSTSSGGFVFGSTNNNSSVNIFTQSSVASSRRKTNSRKK